MKKTLFGLLIVAYLIYLIFWFASPQTTALDSLEFSRKSDDNLVHTTAIKSGGKTSLLDHNQRKSKLSVTNKINHLMEASSGNYSFGQGNPSEHGISQHPTQTSENHHSPDTRVQSSEQMKASESGHLVVKTGKEKGRRRKRKSLGAKLTALSEVSSSQSGNSTPSSPLSPVTMPKYNWPLSSDVEQPLETLISTTLGGCTTFCKQPRFGFKACFSSSVTFSFKKRYNYQYTRSVSSCFFSFSCRRTFTFVVAIRI